MIKVLRNENNIIWVKGMHGWRFSSSSGIFSIITILFLSLIVTGCTGSAGENIPPSTVAFEKITVSPSKFEILKFEKVEGYRYVYLTVTSNKEINVFVLPSEEDVDGYLNKEYFEYYPLLSRYNDNEYFAYSIVDTDMWIVITNAAYSTADVELWVVQSVYSKRGY